MGLLSCNADPTQTGKSWLQILHSTTRRPSTFACLFWIAPTEASTAAIFTQPIQNEESLAPLE